MFCTELNYQSSLARLLQLIFLLFCQNFGEMLYDAIAGDPVQRWRDKSYNAVWTSNGAYEASADHTVLDGMVLVMYNQFTTMSLQLCNGMWSGKSETGLLNYCF